MKVVYLVAVFFLLFNMIYGSAHAQTKNEAIKVAVLGATHGHFNWVARLKDDSSNIKLMGIFEPNQELAERYIKRHQFKSNLFYQDLNKMLDEVKPEAVVAFGSIYEHMAAVEACAPRGIHVMVEKPLATNTDHAHKMAKLAAENNIILLTNYETSWYPTIEKAYQLINENAIGKIRKVIVHAGHQGPKEIGVSKEFLDWLTDPVQNGGGALIDFGCYGANIMTYLMNGQEPVAVTAVTRQYKPRIYPNVDDDATVIVDYPDAQCIIQASWNWPFNRKDMEVYGETGYIITKDNQNMSLRKRAGSEQNMLVIADEVGVYTDPFAYFADVIRGKIEVPKHGLYSLENNLTVVKILEAARESARTGKKIQLK